MVKQVVTQIVKQTNAAGELTHLLTLEGMPKEQIVHILDTAQQFVSVTDPAREVKKVPLLRGKSVFNLFLKTRPAPARPLKLRLIAYRLMSSI